MAKKKQSQEVSLKGTLVSVMVIGVIIIAMWFSVYFMYLGR